MTPKNRTLEGKNRTLGGRGGGSKIVENRRTSFMYTPLPEWDLSNFLIQPTERQKTCQKKVVTNYNVNIRQL